VVVGVLLATLVVLVLLVVFLVRRLTAMTRQVRELERRLTPALTQLQQDAAVTGAELERVGEALSRVGRADNG
jgi:predicted Holliday junction resolvase-like endonuclease